MIAQCPSAPVPRGGDSSEGTTVIAPAGCGVRNLTPTTWYQLAGVTELG